MKGFGDHYKSNPQKTNRKSELKIKIINNALNLHSQGRILEAAECYKEFINKGFIDHRVFSNYGLILKDFGKLKEAEMLQRKSIEIEPNYSIAYTNLGGILKDLGNLEEAEISTRKAIELRPYDAQAYSNLGTILKDLRKSKEAEISFKKAISLRPDFADAYYNMGTVLRDLGKLKEAVIYTCKAIEINPKYASAYANLGAIMSDLGKFHDAINNYHKALEIDENLSIAKFGLIKTKGIICDWRNQKTERKWLENIGLEESYLNPLTLFYYQDNPLKHLKRAKNLYLKKYHKPSKDISPSESKKIRIGYFSSDFRAHPVMYLISSILKLHDKSRFKIYLYSFAPQEDEYTEIAKNSGCIFKDIKDLTDLEAVELARKNSIDIAIDLMGYTKNNRMNIFSYRVAPIQINYLGYPGSVGSDSIDYIIADKITIPNQYQNFYKEKIIRMPSCYLCNDDNKKICDEPISRKEYNLPEKAFVFTCFCDNKKITSKEFNIWMRLLTKIKGSVLWLYKSNEYSMDNLIKEAQKRNVDSKRLIFASKLPLLKKHLARYSLGDLGLDTFNYNGHATTSDALWSGLPVLTKIGKGFPSRVSASLLTSVGLPELITYSEKEYEEKALYFALNRKNLSVIKSKLVELREKSPLFNSELFTRNLEQKYTDLIKNLKQT